jgi:PPE-repeat protein
LVTAAAPAASAASSASVAGSVGSGLGGAGVSAGLGEAASVGGLSVPQTWGTAAPEIQLAAKSLPLTALEGLQAAPAGAAGMYGGGVPAIGPIGSVVNAPRNGESRSRFGDRRAAMRQTVGESSPDERAAGRWGGFDLFAPDGQVSGRDEINRIRAAIAGVSKERDVLKRSASLLIKEALHDKAQ